eukprot:1782404-Rhodomonas_salina.1
MRDCSWAVSIVVSWPLGFTLWGFTVKGLGCSRSTDWQCLVVAVHVPCEPHARTAAIESRLKVTSADS